MKKLFLLLTISLISLQLFAQYDKKIVWDTITFEESYQYIVVDTSKQNIWQIGEPHKTFFDSAYSATNAIITDTLNSYPANNNSYFDLKIGEFNFGSFYSHDVFIEIKHKLDTDTLRDGGFITISYDNRATWTNIINDTSYNFGSTPNYNNDNLYSENDTLFNGEFGFSGHSNDWITTWFTWHDIPAKSNMSYWGDTMIIRFNFISDSIENNKEGWLIDDIKLYSVDLGGGIFEIKSFKFNITPNPMVETSVIKLNDYNEIELSIFNIRGRLIRQKNYFNNQSVIINKNNLNSGIYFVKIKADREFSGIRKLIIK